MIQDGRQHLADAIERQRAEEAVRHQALHDPLTGLPNRSLFLDRAAHALERASRTASASAVLFVDIDHFKLVNDSLGHEAGDTLLNALPARLEAVLRPADTIGRFGGDEFLVLCEDLVSEQDAVRLADRVVGAFAEPFRLGDDEHFVSASVGVAFVTSACEDAAALIRDADAAMYRAKQRGRGRYELFDEDMRSRADERRRTENALHGAVERGELQLCWQPLVSLDSGLIEGCEALLRWEHPRLGRMAPGQFVGVAEDSGQILAIGRWALQAACREAHRFASASGEAVPVYVNVSARQVLQPDFADTVREVLEAAALPPARLRLEITESLLLAPLETLLTLREAGVGLVLDDFGRGYSSLSYLHRFPIDILKIDRSFTAALPDHEHAVEVVRAILAMADALRIDALAEGVESEEQLTCLVELGCRAAQDDLFAMAMPGEQLPDLLGRSLVPGALRPG